MKSLIKYFILIVIFSGNLLSQGFDWQYDMRMPFKYPDLFISLSADYGLTSHSGDFGFLENEIKCCNFDSGTGNNITINIGAEYWYNGRNTIFADAGYSNISGDFSSRSSVPRTEDYNLITEYRYNSDLSFINLNIGSRHRIRNSNFFAGAAINSAILFSKNHNFSEVKISPVTDPFRDRTISEGEIKNLNNLFLNASVLIGYDINAGKSRYLSVYIKFNQQLNSFVDNEKWYHRSLITGIKFNRGIFINK